MAGHVKRVDQCIQDLASNCDIATAGDLFSIELSALLDEMQEDYEAWDKHTPDRFIFDMLVRRAETAVVDHWETILMIIASNIDHDKDFELRMDMLSLTEHFLMQSSLHSTIVFYGEIILKMILLPSLAWRVGKPNVSIRKGSIVCLIKMIELALVDPEKLYGCNKQLVTVLKCCLDDDFASDIRFAAVVVCRHLLTYLTEQYEKDDYDLIYPELLKRLDDAQDAIRLETCKVFEIFFDHLPNPWSSSLYEYTIKTIFVHLDDPSEVLQQAVITVLEKAARVQTEEFIVQSADFARKSARPALCKSLTDYAQKLRS
jgi:hypothetical protein